MGNWHRNIMTVWYLMVFFPILFYYFSIFTDSRAVPDVLLHIVTVLKAIHPPQEDKEIKNQIIFILKYQEGYMYCLQLAIWPKQVRLLFKKYSDTVLFTYDIAINSLFVRYFQLITQINSKNNFRIQTMIIILVAFRSNPI